MIEDVGYLDRLERLKLFPYTIDAVRLLNRAGFKVVVVTSQNGVAQGMLTEEFLGRGARASVAAVRSGRREDRGLLLLPAFAARGGRAVPHRLRMPQTEARYDTGRRAGSCARRRRNRSSSAIAGATSRWGWRRARRRCWSRPDTAGPKRRASGEYPARARRREPDRSDELDSTKYVKEGLTHPLPSITPRSSCSTHFRAPRRGDRRSDRRRVHLRPCGARLARGAGADSSIRLDGDRARRRGQRRKQRRRARRHARRSSASPGKTRRASAFMRAWRSRTRAASCARRATARR